MGPVPSQNPFLPIPPNYSQQIMTKVWTFSSEPEACHQLQLLSSIQINQNAQVPNPYCKIACCHLQKINSERCWKVIAAFEYPSRSLRQEIITRKKRERQAMYFTQKEIAQILNLIGLFIINHYANLCSHSDIFSNLFLLNDQFKLCRPELLPLRCQNRYCSNTHFREKIVDDILELMLLEKIVKGGRKDKERAQYLYSHSVWLVELLDEVISDRTDILKLSRQSKYITMKESKTRQEDVLSQFVRRETQKYEPITTEFQLKVSSKGDKEERKLYNQTEMRQSYAQDSKQAEKTKTSFSNKIRRSHSFEQDSEKRQDQNNLSPFYHQHNGKKMLLDQYPRELAESIGDHEDSNSGICQNPYENMNMTDIDPVTYPPDMIETNSLIILEPIISDQNESMRVNKSLGPKVPTTIIEEENQNYSHQSKKTITSNPSLPSLRSQSSQELKVLQIEGSRYEGQVLGGKKHGKGRITYSGGVFYEGDWINDQMEGYGCLFNAEGKPYYRGLWKNGNFHGKGAFFNSDEESIQGCFDYRDFNDIGKKWKSFEGSFDHDKKNGEGILTLTNGETLQAEWQDNTISGRGIFRTLNGQIIKGIWVQNMLYIEESQSEPSQF